MFGKYFPWRLFRNFLFGQMLVLNGALLLSLGVSSYYFNFEFYAWRTLYLIIAFVFISTLSSLGFAYYLTVPFRELILKSLRLATKKYVAEFEEKDVVLTEPGPYVELEIALDRIRRKLQRRRWQLSHEREEAQALMGALDEAILSVDLQEQIVFYNARFAAQFLADQGSNSSSRGYPLTSCFRQPPLLELFSQALKTGKPGSTQIPIFSKLAGVDQNFLIKVWPLREEKSMAIYGALAVFQDITELKKAEKIRIEFVENASHELRTPLTAIKGYLATMVEDLKRGHTDQLGSFLNVAVRNVDRLTELVNDMMTISSLESHPSLKLEKANPLVLTEEVLSRLSQLALQKNIVVTARSHLSELVIDIAKIDQVLMNLIGNALKYIPDHGRVEVEWNLGSDHRIYLSVKDNGPGIPFEHQSRLFERFYRVDRGRSREVGGTGLGLSIVKHIIQSHGGEVKLVSTPGRGAEFICELPLLEPTLARSHFDLGQ